MLYEWGKNMNAVFGGNSFLANNFINYFEDNHIPYISFGQNKPIIHKNNFVLTDHTKKNLSPISKYSISNIYLFKSLVRRDIQDIKEYKNKNAILFDRILDYISKINQVENIHYFSTTNDLSLELNPIYQETKNNQEMKIKEYSNNKDVKLVIHSLPRLIGPRDLNFSRLTPQYLSHKILGTSFELKNPNSMLSFMTVEKLLDIFFQPAYKKNENIIYNTEFSLKVENYLKLLDNYLKEPKNKTYNSLNLNEDFSRYLSFIDWYLDNKSIFRAGYEQWRISN